MKDIPVSKVRNFAVAGHAGTGKTSLADLILFKSGKVSRLGKVQEKNSVSDYRQEEQERGYSVYATPLACQWKEHSLNFIDTPGSADFFGDTTAALTICDSALVVVDGANGIEVGTTKSWKLLNARGCPRFLFINSLDRENSDFFRTLKVLQDAYGATVCVPMTLPVGKEQDFSDVIHVLRTDNVPAELQDEVEKYRTALLDTAAESDEELMMRYLDGEELSEEEVASGLHAAILDGSLVPVFCGSVEKDIGIEQLMNGIVNLFPSPEIAPLPKLAAGEITAADSTGTAFVFKSVMDPFIGQMTFLRVCSGVFRADTDVLNLTRSSKERFGSLLLMNGKEQEIVSEAGPGDLIAVAKLKHTRLNDTLGTANCDVRFAEIEFPKPTMSYACYAKSKGDDDKIGTGLQRLSEEDRTVYLERNAETRELVISGLGDQHLTVIMNRLKRDFKVDVDFRTPKVPYRETITGHGEAKYRHKKQTGGHGQFAEVWMRVEPLPDVDFEFENQVVGGNIPKNYIPSVEKGVVDAMTRGPLANCKVINIKATVFDGKHHPVDSSDMAFQIAGRGAFREAMQKSSPILLEPIMKLRVMIPDQYMGDITADLNQRRGRILGMGTEEGMQVVEAEVPQAETFSYSSQLRSLTQGRGFFDLEFVRYEQVPGNISKQIQEAAQKEAEDEHG